MQCGSRRSLEDGLARAEQLDRDVDQRHDEEREANERECATMASMPRKSEKAAHSFSPTGAQVAHFRVFPTESCFPT